MDHVDVTALADRWRRPQVTGLGDLMRRGFTFPESADLAMHRSSRPPVVFLRSFSDDEIPSWDPTKGGVLGALWQVDPSVQASEFETVIVGSIGGLGPVVAAARPWLSSPQYREFTRKYGEPVEKRDRLVNTNLEWWVNGKLVASLQAPSSPRGARRAYFRSDQWQEVVSDWLQRSQLVIVVLGETGGLVWELEQIMTLRVHDRVIVVIPPYWRPVASAVNNQPTEESREQFRQWQAYWLEQWTRRWHRLYSTLSTTAGPILPATVDPRFTLAVVADAEEPPILLGSRLGDRADYQAAMTVAVTRIHERRPHLRPQPFGWASGDAKATPISPRRWRWARGRRK